MLNQVVIVGRIKEFKESKDGERWCDLFLIYSFSIFITSRNYEDDTIRVRLWNTISENAMEYCKKGDLVGIKGRLQSNGKNNILIVVAEKLTFLSSAKKED